MNDAITTLPQLADPEHYVAARWDLTQDDKKRDYWIGLFAGHFPTLLAEAMREAKDRGADLVDVEQRAQRAQDVFQQYLDVVAAAPGTDGRLDILMICEQRERILRQYQFADPYRLAKSRENKAALPLLKPLLDELDAMPAEQRDIAVVRGMFAGNIFDLGATATVERFTNQQVDFHAVRQQLKPRPWLVDDLDAWLTRLREGTPHRHAVLFVDNAGPDVVLGMLPFARYLLQRGTAVTLAANTTPSLNDVTAEELLTLVQQAGEVDTLLGEAQRDSRLRVLADGNGAPLIDLSRLDPAFVAAVGRAPVDLVVLEGMGRALESNYEARFTCDAIKVAMIKDNGVADAMQGEVYDLVFRFEAGA
ncbi:ARMT1-like domain-containing protein [Phycisphaerales bacterium AB-hyl4]|uniref:ARMT1-like domain-containing protein n=1 Tax=Natronomicrosphaera hydrolytica TaxID=3242702 RepID=A0ABV4U0Q9_9BACT